MKLIPLKTHIASFMILLSPTDLKNKTKMCSGKYKGIKMFVH